MKETFELHKMGSVQSFKWPHFVSVRDDFLISCHIYSAAYMHNYIQCEGGGRGTHLESGSHLGVGVGGVGGLPDRMPDTPKYEKHIDTQKKG
jgi:hypothetical protein